MKFPFREIHSLTDSERNFEFLEQSCIFWGVGAPAFNPVDQNATRQARAAYYFRLDTPTVANQRIYVWNAGTTTWTGIV